MADNRIFEGPNGRLWLGLESHPQSDREVLVCREIQLVGVQYMTGHTAVMSRKVLRPTSFTYGDGNNAETVR